MKLINKLVAMFNKRADTMLIYGTLVVMERANAE